jgi:hypothetical protein
MCPPVCKRVWSFPGGKVKFKIPDYFSPVKFLHLDYGAVDFGRKVLV